jgi:acyl-CoA synthetase (AMP-forming)/AMP-acid ligase II
MPDWGDLLVDQLRFMARRFGDEIAYRDLGSDGAITFGDWDARSNALARGLAGRGVRPGDRVSIYLPSEECIRWVVAYAAVHKAGAVAVPTNTRLSVRELTAILGHAEVRALLTSASLLGNARDVSRALPSIELLVSDGAEEGDVAWDDAFDADDGEYRTEVGPDDLADIMYTSGTTGLPKGVAVRHGNIAMIGNNEPPWTGAGWLHGAPLFTFAGISFIYNPMKMGMRGLYQPKFDAGEWLRIVARERPSMAFLVPAMAELLVAHPDFPTADLDSLQAVSIGSAPLAPNTLLGLQERLPNATVSNSYGMTEAGPAYIVMPKEDVTKRIGSVGKPIPPMEIKIVDEADNDCEVGEVGELLTRLRGYQREYYRDAEATANTWTSDGWLRSGDLGYLDEDGFLYLVGRKKDLIVRGGHNVYPTDIESVILEHPRVQEAAVVGVPHDVLGEDIAAFVVRKPGTTISEDELKDFCALHLADYKRPRQVTFIDTLPRNATGKVMKHRLVERAAGEAAAARPA